jgi:hypothetical protein
MWIGKKKFEALLKASQIDPVLLKRFEKSLDIAKAHGLTLNSDSEMFSAGWDSGRDSVLQYILMKEKNLKRNLTIFEVKEYLTPKKPDVLGKID